LKLILATEYLIIRVNADICMDIDIDGRQRLKVKLSVIKALQMKGW
jgi:hypothetical protein